MYAKQHSVPISPVFKYSPSSWSGSWSLLLGGVGLHIQVLSTDWFYPFRSTVISNDTLIEMQSGRWLSVFERIFHNRDCMGTEKCQSIIADTGRQMCDCQTSLAAATYKLLKEMHRLWTKFGLILLEVEIGNVNRYWCQVDDLTALSQMFATRSRKVLCWFWQYWRKTLFKSVIIH